jgi:hypothetical protein
MIKNPVVWTVAFWLFSSATYSLPEPDDKSSKLYRFTYKFLHLFAANWEKFGKH